MKGKNIFTASEFDRIKSLIIAKVKATPDKQKGIRDKIRKTGFHYSDFTAPPEGYTVAGFETLLRSGQISISDSSTIFIKESKLPPEKDLPINIPENPQNENRSLKFTNIEELKLYGFTGFKEMSGLFLDNSILPNVKGIYMVLNMEKGYPEYLERGSGGFFKGKNPNLTIGELKTNWINNTLVVYIGKAGSEDGKATLKSRLKQYFSFGQGKDIGHYGGRLIWQLKNSRDLVVCWKSLPDESPRNIEAGLIQQFVTLFGNRPRV